jgi:hypothetical protein
MLTLDLLDGLLDHDAWTAPRVLEFGKILTDEQRSSSRRLVTWPCAQPGVASR